jgi:hypothetical protein
MAQAAVQDPDQPVAQGPQGLMVAGTPRWASCSGEHPGEPVKAANAHRWQAVLSRRFPTHRANTTCRNREARVMGAVPGIGLRALALA